MLQPDHAQTVGAPEHGISSTSRLLAYPNVQAQVSLVDTEYPGRSRSTLPSPLESQYDDVALQAFTEPLQSQIQGDASYSDERLNTMNGEMAITNEAHGGGQSGSQRGIDRMDAACAVKRV